MNKLITKFNKKEDGFTLIELLVVVLILGILVAVAVPQFVGQQEKAGNTSAQNDLNTAFKAAGIVRSENGGVLPGTAALTGTALANSEPGLRNRLTTTGTALTATAPLTTPVVGNIAVVLDGSGGVVFYARSGAGKSYCNSTRTGGSVKEIPNGSTVADICNV